MLMACSMKLALFAPWWTWSSATKTTQRAAFAVTSLGKQDMILGFTWLREHNPEIDWTKEEACIEQRAKVFPPPLAFPHREALYEDVQGVGCESPEEEEGGGEWTHTPDAESLNENIEVGDHIYATTLCLPPAVAEIWAIKDTAWQWEPPQQAAFDALKQSVTSKPVLLFLDDDSPFCVEADSSDFATGAVLSQQSKEDGKWHPVAFYSKSLNAVEWNYEIHDKEMLAIIQSFEEWRHFLEGARHKFEVWTDHKNLEYFRFTKKLNRHQARWSLYLANFDFSLHHKPGRSMSKPDALSRRADHGTGAGDNNNIVLLKPELFAIRALEGIVAQGDEANILRNIGQGN
ncbi:hypothetical protein E4T56_gene3291 [Termitomyces sp. T112]|nr:hypothetical protein E4T56_gene3291 [Termitomyces sp. T112]